MLTKSWIFALSHNPVHNCSKTNKFQESKKGVMWGRNCSTVTSRFGGSGFAWSDDMFQGSIATHLPKRVRMGFNEASLLVTIEEIQSSCSKKRTAKCSSHQKIKCCLVDLATAERTKYTRKNPTANQQKQNQIRTSYIPWSTHKTASNLQFRASKPIVRWTNIKNAKYSPFKTAKPQRNHEEKEWQKIKTRTGDTIKQKGANLFPGYHRLQSAVSNATYNTIPGAIAIDTHGSTRTTITSPISFLASPQWIQLNARHSTCKMSLTKVSWSITSVALG